MTAKQIVPKLRFPEFSDDWDESTLGKHFQFKNGVNADRSAYGKGRKFINVLDIISEGPITYDEIIGSVEISDVEFAKNEVSYGDILFQRSSETREEVGQSNVYLDREKNATFGGFVIRGKPIAEHDAIYFHYLLGTSRVRKDMTSRSGGSTRYNIGQDAIGQVPVFVARTMDEQRKVASFLQSCEDKVEQLSCKKALLSDYKSGCMQQIFTQKVRFMDDQGNCFPNWLETNLGDLGEVRTSSVDKLSREGEKTAKLLNYMDVYRRDHIRGTDTFQDITAPDGQFAAASLKEGDILFTPSSETPTDIGHSAVVTEDLPNVLFSYHLMRFRPEPEVLLPEFSGYAFKSYSFYAELWRKAQGATRYTLSKSALEEATVSIPSSLEEQKKISDFLSTIDTKIAAVSEELKHIQTFKKGLLQQMFI